MFLNGPPQLGFGTYRISTEEEILSSIRCALSNGYRLIDSATSYRNEHFIGKALQVCLPEFGLKREDIFITSKLQPSDHGREQALKAIKKSIAEFGPVLEGYIDLYLIHWPASSKFKSNSPQNSLIRRDSWLSLMDAYKEGLLRGIGVSNYTKKHLEEFFNDENVNVLIPPMLNQIELHPLSYGSYLDTIDFCKEKNILIQSYSTLAQGILLGNEFKNLMLSNGIDVHDLDLILLKWAWNHGFLIIPKSSNPLRIKRNAMVAMDNENGGALNIKVPMQLLDNLSIKLEGLNERGHCCWDPFNVE